jgi:hypothetical protein
MTHPFGSYNGGLIRRMPDTNGISLTNFDGLRAGIDLIVYAIFIMCALVLVVVYSIACYTHQSLTAVYRIEIQKVIFC